MCSIRVTEMSSILHPSQGTDCSVVIVIAVLYSLLCSAVMCIINKRIKINYTDAIICKILPLTWPVPTV